jgi:hypothetical protein
MVVRIHTVHDRIETLNREVAMQLDHGMAGLDHVRAVDLYLVVILGPRRGRKESCRETQKDQPGTPSEMTLRCAIPAADDKCGKDRLAPL